MKLTVQQVYDATLLIARIIREQRPMPQRGKYKLARMHAKLLPEFNPISEQRDAMITAYNYHAMVSVASKYDPLGQEPTESSQFSVPPDKEAEFAKAWGEIAAQEIEVAVDPIPLAQLDLGDAANGAIEANELIVLGDLVAE